MSEQNVEAVREAVGALNGRDPDAFLAFLHPDVEWGVPATDPFPGLRAVYRGRAEVRRWFEEAFLEPWESFHLEVEEITEASDGRVIAETLFTARGGASGAETEIRTWSVSWHADGRIARRQLFWTREEALEAAGLRE
jgi:ketosteroid isomerase-like protein